MKQKEFPDHIERKNLMVDAGKIRRLKQLLKAESESAAVRQAVQQALDVQQALYAARKLRDLGTLGDAFAHLDVPEAPTA